MFNKAQDWDRQLSPTGHWYYYNKFTKISTYDPPDYPVLTREISGHQITVTRRGEIFCGSGWNLPRDLQQELIYLLAESRGYKTQLPNSHKRMMALGGSEKNQGSRQKRKRKKDNESAETQSKKSEVRTKDQGQANYEQFEEPAFQDTAVSPTSQQELDDPQSPEDDPEGFIKFLEAHANPQKSWTDQLSQLALFDDFDLVGAKARPELFNKWAAKNSCSYLELVKRYWKPGTFYASFKQQYTNLPAFNSTEYSDKQRETIYRDFTRFSKKSAVERHELRDTYKNDTLRLQILDMLD